MTAQELIFLIRRFLACYDEPDSPEALYEAVRVMREAVDNA